MNSHHLIRSGGTWTRRSLWITALLALVCAAHAIPAKAADGPEKAAASLRWIPANASFYSASLRNKEWWDLVSGSRAWARFKELPYVQLAGGFLFAQIDQPDGPLDQIREFFRQPENQPLADLLGDMFSDEVFWFVDEEGVRTAQLLADLYATMYFETRFGEPVRKMLGQEEKTELPTLVLSELADNTQALHVPNLLVGFKLRDPQRAISQLKRLEDILKGAPDAEVRERVSRSKIGEVDCLLLTLDGSMIDWTEFPFEDYAETPGQFDKLVEHLRQQKLILALGVRDEFLLLSIGHSTDHLASLGKGNRLSDRPELKPLAPFADRRLLNITYVSQPMHSIFATGKKDADNMVAALKAIMEQADLDADLQQRLEKDLKELGADLKTLLPDPGALMSFSFLTGQGIESYRHDWSTGSRLDASKTLPLMEHVGAAPLLALVQRGKHAIGEYDLLVKWLRKGHAYFEDLGLPKMDEEQRAEYQKFMTAAGPLLVRLDKTTRDLLFPSLKDGQFGIVVDAQEKSRQWITALPATDTALPMIEPALVVGVSDAALLKKAMAEYFSIANDAVAVAADLSKGQFAKFTLTPPQVQESESGASYRYPLPGEWGVDPQLMPNAWLGKDLAILSLAPQQTERLQKTTPAPTAGLASDASRPLATFVSWDWVGTVNAAAPWIEFGVRRFTNQPNEDGTLPPDSLQTKLILDQLRTTLDILKVFRGITSVQYVQEAAHVTHQEARFQDMP